MKRSTSFMAVALAAVALAAPAKAQIVYDWDDNGQFIIYPEDLVCEGGVSYDEDLGAFVFDGTPGKIMLSIPEGSYLDWTGVARIEVHGTLTDEDGVDNVLTSYAWSDYDPLATFTVYDRDIVNPDGEHIVNTWMGSRYDVNYSAVGDKEYHGGKTYAQLSGHVYEVSWGTRNNTDEEGNVTCPTGEIYIDDIVITKSVEIDPKAISPDMFYEWDNWDETAQPVNLAGCEYNLEKGIGVGTVIYGTSVVLGKQFADLSNYAGIYGKGTPGVSVRLLFNRPDMEGGSAPITECNPEFNEEGEFWFDFEDLKAAEVEKFGEAYPYVHLNTVKMPWNLPEGVETAKILKLNYIEKGEEGGISSVTVDAIADDAMYNIYGQKVNESYKGLVIKNGKKYINK